MAAPPPPPPRRILAPAPYAFHIHQLFHDHEHHHHHHQIQPPQPPPPPLQNEFQFLIHTTTFVLGFFLLTLVFSFISWMLFHPKTPALHVSSARIALITITNTTVAGDCNLTLLLTNPNHHLNAVYERMEITLIYASQHVMISEHYRPSFVQPRNNQTEVKVDMSFYIGGGVVMEAMKDVDKGSLSLGVRVFALLSFRNGRWKMHSQYMRGY